eukprot:TRINITY_DN574_c5_g1_i1.p1 TRINITY_DN574_c5_g1~~TRINITY_DN574_c5_g1_i1.p1  ORF type:complete len:357 (+),score=50.95 TRINITY_DN574_c5_g1_i1:128-1198(+)
MRRWVAVVCIASTACGTPCAVNSLALTQLPDKDGNGNPIVGWVSLSAPACSNANAKQDGEQCAAVLDRGASGVCDTATCNAGTWTPAEISCLPSHYMLSFNIDYTSRLQEAVLKPMLGALQTYLRTLYGIPQDAFSDNNTPAQGVAGSGVTNVRFTYRIAGMTVNQFRDMINTKTATAAADANAEYNTLYELSANPSIDPTPAPLGPCGSCQSPQPPTPPTPVPPTQVAEDQGDDDGFDLIPVLLLVAVCLCILGAFLAFRLWHKKKIERENREHWERGGDPAEPLTTEPKEGDDAEKAPPAPEDDEGVPPITTFDVVPAAPLPVTAPEYNPMLPDSLSPYGKGLGRGRVVDQGGI